MSITDLFKRKCPRCKSTKINVIRESFMHALKRHLTYLAFFITILFVKKPKDQYVCTACGFTWSEN